VGTIELQVPRVRDGSFFPTLLEPRQRAERALVAVVQEAYVQGVSTRRVDELVQALGLTGISKSQVSRLCAELDGEVERFRTRRLTGAYPYGWVDATYVKVRDQGRVVSMAVVLAIRGARHWGARRAGARRGVERGRRLLAAVPAQPGGAGAQWGAVGGE
jgi:transposase-like protein